MGMGDDVLAAYNQKRAEERERATPPRPVPTVYLISPCTKPRQTQRDKWLDPPRKGVAAYRAFADQIRGAMNSIPLSGAHVTFVVPMPGSWSPHKRALYDGARHQQRPDIDNLLKALLDAVCPANDCMVWDIRASKIWGTRGEIRICVIGGDK